MSQADIDLALQLISDRLPHLRHPRRLDPCAFSEGSRVLGQYRLIGDRLLLNARYQNALTDRQALELLDTVLHELLHKNSPPLRQLRDTLLAHPRIWNEAARLSAHLAFEFLARRRVCNATEIAEVDATKA